MAPKKRLKLPKKVPQAAALFACGILIGAAAVYWFTREEPYRPMLTDFPEYADRADRDKPTAPKRAAKREPKPKASVSAAPAVPPQAATAPAAASQAAALPTPRVVFVLDDWGYNLDALPYLREIRRPLTLAILPGLKYTAAVARDGEALGHDVILHMPMEAKSPVPQEKLILTAGMPAADAEKTLTQALATVPNAKGVSNHQGSKATEDPKLMSAVIGALKKKNLYFFDSLTTNNSAADEAAGEHGAKYVKRDIFLDNERTEEAIQARLDELKELAKKRGLAIGIGHDEPITLKKILENIPSFEQEGIQVVSLSEIYA